ncbi:hypothetical protein [Brevundimonas sp. CEF1]|uniref:hypothetical protein n=1 Tax=Brevundimonas sp. CEF1 TaxID=3442642 RepID=UPI003F50EAF7
MTTTPSPSINVIVPTGMSTGPWTTGWTYASSDDVWIYIETDGVAGPDLVLDADFTLTAANPQENGGAVTLMPGALPAGGWVAGKHRLILRRWTGRRQSVALPDAEGHKPRATELALDRQMRIAEELSDELDLAVVVPPGATPPSPADLAAAAEAGANAQAALVAAEAAAGQVFGKADADGSNVGPSFAEGAQIKLAVAGASERSLADKLSEQLSLDDFGGTGVAQLNAALAAAGDRGRPVILKSGAELALDEAPLGGVFTVWAEGDFTRTGAYTGPIGGKLIQPTGTKLLYDPFYGGQWPNADGTFPFEEAFRALQPDHPTGLRTLSVATLAFASPNGSTAGVFTSRSSDGGSIGSGFALASYVINDRTIAEHGGVHGMWLFQGMAVRKADAGTTFGMEPGVVNLGDIQVRHPYYAYADKLTCAMWMASGGEIAGANPISAYAAMVYNGQSAMTGLLVTVGALEDRGGGYGELMALPQKTYIGQYLDNGGGALGQLGFQFAMGVSSYLKGSRITADDNGIQLSSFHDNRNWMFLNRDGVTFGPDGSPWFTADNSGLTVKGRPTSANWVRFYGEGAGTGEAVVLAEGADANVWLLLTGKGNGRIKLPNTADYANDAAAATGGVPLGGVYRTGNALRVRIA